jgi:ribose transport system substrate-binding protein
MSSGIGLCAVALLAVSTTGAGASTTKSGIAAAKAQLTKYMGPAVWTSPGPAFDASKAKGKTVWYIPSLYSVPIFHTISGEMKTALSKVGVSLNVCDGQGIPTDMLNCVNEAVAQNAGAIIYDSVYSTTIASGIANAKAHNIPVIMGNDQSPGGPLPLGVSAQVSFAYTLSGRLVSDWIIGDSKGHANVLLTNTTDNPNTSSVLTAGYLYALHHNCPACKETVKSLTISEWATGLGTITSSALTANPNINYVVPEYDAMTAYMTPAIQAMGAAKVKSVKIATFNADLQQMQQMAARQFVFVDVGSNSAYEGWAYADQALRLMAGVAPVVDEHVPTRVFTRQNVKGLPLTIAAANSGQWYGSTAYEGSYMKLWGVKG